MPGKKKGKKKGRSGKSRKSNKDSDSTSPVRRDPMTPMHHVPPPPRPGEQLLKLLTTHKVDEKELHGFKVSTRALKELTSQEIKDLKIVFDAFDPKEKGSLGATELKKAMKVLGFKVDRDQAKQMIRDMTTRGSNSLDFNEFLDLIIERQGDSRDVYDEILQGFNLFDYDGTGQMTMDNLKQACVEAGVKFSKQELEDMMLEADHNGDGIVDKEEFIKVMLQTNLF